MGDVRNTPEEKMWVDIDTHMKLEEEVKVLRGQVDFWKDRLANHIKHQCKTSEKLVIATDTLEKIFHREENCEDFTYGVDDWMTLAREALAKIKAP